MHIGTIETFLAIERAGSFHGAAREMNLTQTAVSARIRGLEDKLGVSLFERGPAGARLSPAGRQFRPYAEQLVRTWAYVASGLSAAMRDRVALRLGSQLSIWDDMLVDVTVWLERERGKVPFTLNYDHALNMAEAVRQQLLDLAIVNAAPEGTRLAVAEFAPEPMVMVSDRPLSLGTGDWPLFINLELGPDYERQLSQVLPVPERQYIVLGNAAMGLRFLLRRGGVGLFPEAMVRRALRKGRLFAVAGVPEMALACYALYRPDNALVEDVLAGIRAVRGG